MNDKNDKLFRCSTFNGDTADGRTLWPDWLRDVELVLDEWSWAVMNGKTMSHNKYKKLKGKKKLTEADQAAIDNVLDKACKSSAATKGRKQVKDWRTEMQGDDDAFLTFMRQTEKDILLLLQRNTAGEAQQIVAGIQIGSACGRKAYAELARIYGRAKEEDTENLINRLRGALTMKGSDGEYRTFDEGDNVNVHIRVLEELRSRLVLLVPTMDSDMA